jgi:hypothetical protein
MNPVISRSSIGRLQGFPRDKDSGGKSSLPPAVLPIWMKPLHQPAHVFAQLGVRRRWLNAEHPIVICARREQYALQIKHRRLANRLDASSGEPLGARTGLRAARGDLDDVENVAWQRLPLNNVGKNRHCGKVKSEVQGSRTGHQAPRFVFLWVSLAGASSP